MDTWKSSTRTTPRMLQRVYCSRPECPYHSCERIALKIMSSPAAAVCFSPGPRDSEPEYHGAEAKGGRGNTLHWRWLGALGSCMSSSIGREAIGYLRSDRLHHDRRTGELVSLVRSSSGLTSLLLWDRGRSAQLLFVGRGRDR